MIGKQYVEPKPKKASNPYLIGFSVLLVLAVVAVFFQFSITGNPVLVNIDSQDAKELDLFFACLMSKNIKLYGTIWSEKTNQQKEMLKGALLDIPYINCSEKLGDTRHKDCVSKDISTYPTWEVNQKIYPGKKSYSELSAISGCELN